MDSIANAGVATANTITDLFPQFGNGVDEDTFQQYLEAQYEIAKLTETPLPVETELQNDKPVIIEACASAVAPFNEDIDAKAAQLKDELDFNAFIPNFLC